MKSGLSRELIALRVAKEFRDRDYVNLGIGLPTLASNFIPEGMEVILHAENGVLGYGRIANEDEANPDLINAGSQPLTLKPGASFFHSADAFAMIRGGYINISVLGAYQVSEKGDLANWWRADTALPNIGGAMDVACGARRIFVAMEHAARDGKPKIVAECSLPLTAVRCVSTIFTDIAVIDITERGLVLREVVPGWTVEEVQALTAPRLICEPEPAIMEL